LAINNSIGKNAYFEDEVAEKLGDILLKDYPLLIASRYKIENLKIDASTLLEEIAKNKKLPLKNLSIDRERAGGALLNDYRQGLLGFISLESPSSRYLKK
jgi:ribosome biogenesis GTPase A